MSIVTELVITDIVGATKINAVSGIATHKNNREQWGIAIKITGSTEYTCNGRVIKSDCRNIVVLPKGCSYSWQSFGGECLIIDFKANLTFGEIIGFSVKDCSHIARLFFKIENERVVQSPFFRIKSLEYTYAILSELLEAQQIQYVPSKKQRLIQPVIDYISLNYSNSDLSNTILSQISGVSNVYFRKVFTELYGCPPMEYVYRLRLEKAAEMLRSDYNSVSAVANAVGYNSVYHFSKVFKKHFGVCPSRISTHE